MSAMGQAVRPVVIVGASHAGVAAASELRNAGYEDEIVLVGEEAGMPYHRPHLSKESLAGEMPTPKLIRPESFYLERGITLRPKTRVTRIDRQAKRLVLSDGSILFYGALILAIGASARRLPHTIKGADKALLLRDKKDWERLSDTLRSSASLAVIGGGLIGLEVAAAARDRGLSVTVIEAAPRLMARSLYPELAAEVLEHHLARGIDIRLGSTVTAITQTGLFLATGESIGTQCVLASTGSVPRTDLAEAAGLTCSNGIDTDAEGRTVDPAIFALGDCAHWDHRGTAERHESLAATQFQAKAIATALTDTSAPGLTPLRLWSFQGAMRLQMSGPVLDDVEIEIQVLEDNGLLLRARRDDCLVAIQAMNAPRSFNASVSELGRLQRVPLSSAASLP